VKMVFCFSGKSSTGLFRESVEEYRKRITKYVPVEIIETRNIRPQSREGMHIALVPGGSSLNSEELAQFLEKHLHTGTRHLFFYTGGPDGFPDAIIQCADLSLSLSQMTFNHQLIRIMLLEQVYRAFTIIHREPYHR
jgi:23S rRNA (pseudouridine1915-N3)-methyltransferase